jgi:hypothetical protein
MAQEEEAFAPLVPRAARPERVDPAGGFRRRQVSPPARELAGEALECVLDPGVRIAYERPPRVGLEHHLVLREGRLAVSLDRVRYELGPGDCLRYRLAGASVFETPEGYGARYWLFLV